ncbi:TPA: hypothetical protein ACH3X2_002683 [Trebouxia sp. C0005]
MYGDRQYWEDRYQGGVVGHCQQKGVISNEWYLQYPALQTILHQHTRRHHQTLVLGCGLSLLAENMLDDGYQSLLAIDYSEHCIQTMHARGTHKPKKAVAYAVMDVTALQLQDNSIDTVIDKATLDCLMNCDDWQAQVQRMLGQAARVLKPNGKFICISHSEPEDRIHMLTGCAYSWKLVQHVEVQKNTATFYVYILQKQ